MVTKDRRFREGKGGDGPGPGSYEVSGASGIASNCKQ